MVYGRLDVYWPDGPIESYQLEKPSIAIGRSSGNDIVLDTNAVSRYHVTITQTNGQVNLVDLESANGTYLEGQRMKAHEPYALRGGEEIQIGDIRLVFNPEQLPPDIADIITRPIPKDSQDTRRIEIVRPSYKVELDAPEQSVTPGAHVQATLGIENISEDSDRYYVEVEGIPKDWVRLDRAEVVLDPGQRSQVVISFKPLRRSESKPGEYTVTIRVRSKSKPAQGVETTMALQLRAFSGFGIVLGTPQIEANAPFEVHVHNQGSGPLPLTFSGAAPGGGLVFDIRPPGVIMGPGERQVIRGYVRPSRNALFGKPRERRFDFLARSQDPSRFLTAVQGMVVERPPLPMWVPTVILPLIALLVIGGLALGVLVISRPRPPVISDFSVSANQVLEGGSVVLAWTVSNAGSLSLRLDDGSPQAIDPNLKSISQVMTGAGPHVFTLIAQNGSDTVQRDARVMVTKALKIDAFSVSPNPVLRYVRQDVTITWNATGAANVQFQGIEALTGTPDNLPHPASGQLKLTGTPRDSLELTLVATGSDGKQMTQPVRVEIDNPTCRTTAEAEIRTGPGTNYTVVKTIPTSTHVLPDGRDATSGWIHLVPSPDPQAWLPVSAVTCDRFEPGALTLIETLPPTPVPSATATQPPPTLVIPTFTLTPSKTITLSPTPPPPTAVPPTSIPPTKPPAPTSSIILAVWPG